MRLVCVDPFRVIVPSNYLEGGGSGRYAQYFSDVEEVAFTWQESEASIAIETF